MSKQWQLKRYGLILLSLILLIYMFFAVMSHPRPKLVEPALPVATSPYQQSIAGVGVTEAQTENFVIGTSIPGIIADVFVKNGQKVMKGQSLFSIDSRDATSRLLSAKASLAFAITQLKEAQHKLTFYENVDDKRAISNEELITRRDSVALAKARVSEAEASVQVIETEINRLTVRSPIDATILKIYIHPGEYAYASDNPLLILGNIDTMHVRVEIDETLAGDISPDAPAIGYLRGYNQRKIPLKFIRIEPLLRSKKSISNQGNELTDTRVLVILYSFDNTQINAYPGQQMDVYIEKKYK